MKNLMSEVTFHFALLLSKTSIHDILTAHLCQKLRIVDKYQLQRRLNEKDFDAVYIDDSHAK